ncbi:MAG: hypothetical protein ABI994_01925 [Gemmatimonadales bacterium]
MMVLSALRPDASLAEFLVQRARSASIRRLAANAVAGAVGFAAALWWRPTGWLIFDSAALCFLSYGAWGILDRVRSRSAVTARRPLAGLLDATCVLFALLGALAAAGVLLGVWALGLGTWIS